MRSGSLWLLLAIMLVDVRPAVAFDGARLPVAYRVNQFVTRLPIVSVFVAPRAPIVLEFIEGGASHLQWRGELVPVVDRSVRIEAPGSAGVATLEVHFGAAGDRGEETVARINVFTHRPLAQARDGVLDGYWIGDYPASVQHGQRVLLAPVGVFEVNGANEAMRVTPNVRLGELVSGQPGGYPRFVVVRTELLLKLETILAALNRRGYPVERLAIRSAYRTPWFNGTSPRDAQSNHIWGTAADIYIDESPADGRMDDLDLDGEIGRGDAQWLADFIGSLVERDEFGPQSVGIGVFGATSSEGPFVHIDVRSDVRSKVGR